MIATAEKVGRKFLNFSCKARKNVIPRRDEAEKGCFRLYTLLVLIYLKEAMGMKQGKGRRKKRLRAKW